MVTPGDVVLQLPEEGDVRIGVGLRIQEETLVSQRAGVLKQTKAGRLWVEGRQKRCVGWQRWGGLAQACGRAGSVCEAWPRLLPSPRFCILSHINSAISTAAAKLVQLLIFCATQVHPSRG